VVALSHLKCSCGKKLSSIEGCSSDDLLPHRLTLIRGNLSELREPDSHDKQNKTKWIFHKIYTYEIRNVLVYDLTYSRIIDEVDWVSAGDVFMFRLKSEMFSQEAAEFILEIADTVENENTCVVIDFIVDFHALGYPGKVLFFKCLIVGNNHKLGVKPTAKIYPAYSLCLDMSGEIVVCDKTIDLIS